jgi:hypothetical protein
MHKLRIKSNKHYHYALLEQLCEIGQTHFTTLHLEEFPLLGCNHGHGKFPATFENNS